jgi:uncharacterized protein YggE
MAATRFAVLALSFAPLSMSAALALVAPAPLQAQPLTCSGTLLQLQVQLQGAVAADRFRFDLGLEAEATSKAEALDLLNQRLAVLRRVLAPLSSGALTIPAPATYRSGGGGSGQVRERATTSVSGQVSKADYDALIQSAGRLPGVTLQGFTAQAADDSAIKLQSRLLRQALDEGKRQAKTTADALGLPRVQLLRIDQRSGGIRPVPYGLAAARSFNPDEAPAPQGSLSLALDYCLS